MSWADTIEKTEPTHKETAENETHTAENKMQNEHTRTIRRELKMDCLRLAQGCQIQDPERLLKAAQDFYKWARS